MNGSSSEALDFMEWFCGPLKMRRVPQEAFFGTEYVFRTVGACFLHRMPQKTRRVPQEAFFGTEYVFRTVGGRFWYRVPSKEQGKGPPETSSALAGPRKWRKGPERTKRAESSRKQAASAAELRTSQKKEVDLSSTSLTDLTLIAIICAGENCSAGIKGQRSLSQ